VVRNYVHLLSNGASKWFYYNIFVSHRPDRVETNGFFEWDGSPRPLAVANANLSWVLGNAIYNKKLVLTNGTSGVAFRQGKRNIYIIWGDDWSSSKFVSVDTGSEFNQYHYAIYDVTGVREKAGIVTTGVKLMVNRVPKYIVFSKDFIVKE